MMDSELFAFMDVFRGLQRVFPKRLDEHEISQMGGAYFKAMRRFPINAVQAGADTWTQRGKFFPKPAEWMDAIPRAAQPQAERAELSVSDAAEYRDAEQRRYEGEPCRCSACRTAGVDHRFLRFVPDVDANGQDLQAKLGDRIVVCGHWAHGEELRRWYAAKEAFWAQFQVTLPHHVMSR